MLKQIVFDFGGVILNLDGVYSSYPAHLSEIFNLPLAETQSLWALHKTSVMTGQETPADFLARMKRELNLTFDLSDGLALWEKRNTITKDRIDWKLIAMIAELKSKYQIHILTDQIQLKNGSDAWIEEINQHFTTILRSYEQGFCKPDPAAYQNLLTKIRALHQPETVLFIDDTEKNIIAAEKAGIRGLAYRFGDCEALTLTLHM